MEYGGFIKMAFGNKGSAVLMTEGPIATKMVRFAIPVFCSNLFQQLYNTIDALIVGRYVGDEALASVSSSGSFIFMMVGFIFGLFAGAGVIVSQAFGAGDKEKVQNAVHTTMALGIIAGVILTGIGMVFSPQILRWMNTPADVLPNSIIYFRIYFAGSLFHVMYNACSGVFQAVGDSKHPLIYLIVSSVSNVILDLLFVAVFKWGIAGAAIATCLSHAISFVLIFGKLMHSDDIFRVHIKKIRIHRELVRPILKVGIPSGVQNAVIGFANIIVQSNINSFGKLAMAGCGSYSKLEGFVFLPITSFCMALTTFTGQNIGANRLDRAKKGALFGIISAVTCAELLGFVMYVFCPGMIAWFSSTPETIAFGVQWARTTSLFFCLLAFSHASAAIMRGAGKSIVPMVVMLAFWCVVRVTYITIITHYIPKISVVFWAYPLTWGLSSITFMIYLLSGKWLVAKKKLV